MILFAIYNRQFLHTYLHDNNDIPYVAFYIRVIQVWFEKLEKLEIALEFVFTSFV